MFDAFINSFKLRNTYKTNALLYSLKCLPLIGKIFPDSLYSVGFLKIIANILSILYEFVWIFLGKAIYLLVLWAITVTIDRDSANAFSHLIIFLTIAGGYLNTHIFNPSKDKYYAIVLMRMDAKKYAMSNYIYFLSKLIVGFTIFSLIFGRLSGISYITCFAIPIYVCCVKLCFSACELATAKRKKKIRNENKFSVLMWISTIVLLIISALPYFGYGLTENILLILTAVMIVPGIASLIYIIGFDSFRFVYKELLKPENYSINVSSKGSIQQEALQKKISVGKEGVSNKQGYKYFNELFMKRHSKILTKTAKTIAAVAATIIVAVLVVIYLFPDERAGINSIFLTYLPYFLFIMYAINCGRTITQAMFMNCDHSMLTYRFYRQPKAILQLFVERLKYIVYINLLPAGVIAIGLPLLLYASGGTSNPLNYVFLFVSIISMSVFFSVHSIVIYYLLQPYNVNLESKGVAYNIINWVTYIICYMGIQFKLPTIAFGSAITAFCVIYVIVAFILAYRLAPKTFKLRN